MKTAVFLIFTIFSQAFYCSGGPDHVEPDDYLDRLKATIGKQDHAELAYLDLRKIPMDDSQLLPLKKGYIFLNSDVVVECTAETLIFECILGAHGLTERNSFKLTNIAEAFARQKLSVRGIKLRMAHWLESAQHRFVNKSGLPSQLKRDRDLAKLSNVFGLYSREEFLASCRPIAPIVRDVSSVLALLLLESLLKKDTLRGDHVVSHHSDTDTVDTVMTDVDEKRKKKAAERKRKQRQKRKAKRQKMFIKDGASDQGCQADRERSGLIQEEDLDGISGEEDSDLEPEVVVATPSESAPLPKVSTLPSSGCVDDLVSLMLPDPKLQLVTHTRRCSLLQVKRSCPIPSVSPTRSSRSVTPPHSPPKAIYALDWGGVKDEYLNILETSGNSALLRNFQDFLTAVRASGIKGMKGVEKLVDGTFSYRLNDYYRVVFTINDASKILTLLSGIEHYS